MHRCYLKPWSSFDFGLLDFKVGSIFIDGAIIHLIVVVLLKNAFLRYDSNLVLFLFNWAYSQQSTGFPLSFFDLFSNLFTLVVILSWGILHLFDLSLFLIFFLLFFFLFYDYSLLVFSTLESFAAKFD